MIRLALASVLLLSMTGLSHGQGTRADPRTDEIRRVLGLSPADLEQIDRGELVIRALDRTERKYMGAVGIGRFAVPPGFLVQRFHDIESFKKNRMVLALGMLSPSPRAEDLGRLTLERADVDALRACRPGSCGLRLGAEQLAQFKAAGLLAGPDTHARVDGWFRGMLAAYARAYLERGNDALMTYVDQREPVSLQAESVALLDRTAELDRAPGLKDHLKHFPASPMSGAEEYLYWSKEAFGLKPVMSLTHITIAAPADVTRGVTVMSSKQIYASHYMDASLAVTIVMPVPDAPNAVYVVYVNRSRTNIPGGIFAPLARSIVQRRTVDGMRNTLSETRERTETDYRASTHPRP